jgi:predicted transcriptional regulator
MDKEWNGVSELNERDINVLQIIDEDDLTCFTFEGLKRRLKIHQETLSRILSRLTEEEILKKINNHYTLTSKAKELLETPNPEFNKHPITLLQTILPPQIPINKITSNLKGKWFGTLRWLGYSNTNEHIALKWITKDGEAIITAIFSQGKLCIEAKAVSENDENDALNASYQLMGYITKLISKTEHN